MLLSRDNHFPMKTEKTAVDRKSVCHFTTGEEYFKSYHPFRIPLWASCSVVSLTRIDFVKNA